MAEDKISIEVYKSKNAGELTQLLADPSCKAETGSASACAAALASALAVRAAAIAAEGASGERLGYILRNTGIIREYMVHLIDEDVKCRAPLRRALKEGGERELEACRQSACSINAEIINMMSQCLELLDELSGMAGGEAAHYMGEAAELAMGAVRCSRRYILHLASASCDDTYRFVTKRENDITLEHCQTLYRNIAERTEDRL